MSASSTPSTRSSPRKASATPKRYAEASLESDDEWTSPAASPSKRARTSLAKASLDGTPPSSPAKKIKKAPASPAALPSLTGPPVDAPLTVASHLSFSLNEAKAHLIAADPRFRVMFEKVHAKPFDLETDDSRDASNHVNAFRSLATSILGQQISWLAARAITHRFLRLYFPHLPEKYEKSVDEFPTPLQVFQTSVPDLRSAGLSQRKAEYLLDLSARFADGRLTAEKLTAMTDEEVKEALIAVRGLGPWTVDMFSMFTLRRPNVLAPGDLGLQKGLIRWYGFDKPAIIPAKTVPPVVPPSVPTASSSPLLTEPANESVQLHQAEFPPAPPFPESETLTKDKLRARLSKKIKGNIYLTPKEMEELTAAWAPYRSLGMYYMWSLAGE